jgi:hypothetical protein
MPFEYLALGELMCHPDLQGPIPAFIGLALQQLQGSPAVAVYRAPTTGEPHVAYAIHVLDVVNGQTSVIRSVIDPNLFPSFGLAPDHSWRGRQDEHCSCLVSM